MTLKNNLSLFFVCSFTTISCGNLPLPLADGEACLSGYQCFNQVCDNGICQPPSCNDNKYNGNEDGVDCHDTNHPMGPCLLCNMSPCNRGADCQSGCCAYHIVEFFCAPSTECTN